MLLDIRANTEYDPGWDERGGIFIARHKVNQFENDMMLKSAISICFFFFSFSFKLCDWIDSS